MLEDLHFIRPWWLLGIVAALLAALYWARRRVNSSHWEENIAPDLLEVLLEPGGARRGTRLPWLAAAALSLAAVGLAGPSWERLPQPVEQRGDALVIILDLSLSMFAEDVAPSRLVRARQKITDVLRRRDEGFTALVAYAGDAHAVVPLTDDTRTIENLLTALRPDMMPVLGSNLASALDVARTLFDNSRMNQGRILLVTDGVDRMSDATERRNRNFPLSILGVGTEAGAPIPLEFVNQPGEVLRTDQGETILPRLDEQRLRNIAEISYGRYHRLGLDDRDIDYLLAAPMPGADETLEVDREFDTWADQGFWVCIVLLPLMLAAFRRGTLAAIPPLLPAGALLTAAVAGALLGALPAPARAGVWDDLWQRRDQQAYQAINEGEPETAAALFKDPGWRAAALYRSEDYASAASAYAGQDDPTGLYNLGNALARLGQYQSAIQAYDDVLARNPEHEDAAFNKALVEDLLEQQRSSEGENQSGDGDPSEAQENARNQSEGSAQQDQADQQQGQPPEQPDQESPSDEAPAEPGEPEEREETAQTSRDEREDALEQWLRRVPDDPGGLLRRKFQYETNQRLRRGDYRSRESEKIW